LKKLLVIALKWGASIAILAFLCVQAYQNDVFGQLADRPKQWPLLASALGVYFTALTITVLRWWILVRALGMALTLREALRIGFLAYLFNLAPMGIGIVGGDLLKAFLLAHRQAGRRVDALAGVVVDRVVGLLVLLMVASVAVFATDLGRSPDEMLRKLALAIWIITLCGLVGTVMVLGPDVTGGRWAVLVERIPYVGKTLRRAIDALRAYRHHLSALSAAACMSAAVHILLAVSVFLLAAGLYQQTPSLAMHFVMVPTSLATGVVPINYGPFEVVLNLLYARIPCSDGAYMVQGQGFVVALGYRIVTLLSAAVGLAYYLAGRRDVAEAIHDEVEAEQAGVL